MKHLRNQRITRAVAVPAVLVLGLAACDPGTDDPDPEPIEDEDTDEPDEPDDEPEDEPEDPDDELDAEPTALPEGTFGPECDRILDEVDVDTEPGAADTGDTDDVDDAADDATAGDDVNGADDNGLDDNGADDNGADDNGADDNGADDNGADDNGADDNGLDDNGADDIGDATDDETSPEAYLAGLDVATALQTIPEFQAIADALRASDLAADLEEATQVTAFAPTSDAFDDAEAGTTPGTDDTDDELGDDDATDGLTEDDAADDDATDDGVADDEAITDDNGLDGGAPDDVDALLSRHLVADEALDAQRLYEEGSVSTISGEEITIEVEDDVVTDEDDGLDDNGLDDNGPDDNGPDDNGPDDNGPDDNGPDDVDVAGEPRVTVELGGVTAEVVCANITLSDGYIHVIDAVLGEDEAATDDTGELDDDVDEDVEDAEPEDDAGDETGDGLEDDADELD